MQSKQLPDEIRKVAMDFDNAIKNRNMESIMSSFSDDCEIELLGTKLTGKEGAARWINWLYRHLAQVEFIPVTIMVEGDTFFEEFVVKARLHIGTDIQSKQAEVLVYENCKLKSLRMYFDRLDFADSVAREFIDKAIGRQLIRTSLKGLRV